MKVLLARIRRLMKDFQNECIYKTKSGAIDFSWAFMSFCDDVKNVLQRACKMNVKIWGTNAHTTLEILAARINILNGLIV